MHSIHTLFYPNTLLLQLFLKNGASINTLVHGDLHLVDISVECTMICPSAANMHQRGQWLEYNNRGQNPPHPIHLLIYHI
jgi:hypothetical protein